jgi:hypothetical protein
MNSVQDDSLTPLLKAQGANLNLDAPSAFAMDEAFPAPPALRPIAVTPQIVCRRCLHPGVDVRILECGCCFHAVSAMRYLAKTTEWNSAGYLI